MDPGILVFLPESACPDGSIPSTAIWSKGGAIGTQDPVHLLYWGQDWQTRVDPNTGGLLANSFTSAVQAILAGAWMSGLRQYGVKRCPFGSASIVPYDPPLLPNTFDDGDVENMIQSRIDAGQFPEPDEPGGRNLYVAIMPPNTKHPDSHGVPISGKHSSFMTGSVIDVDTAWYAIVCNNPFTEMIRTFSHELAEMCSDPEDDGWRVYSAPRGCDEIGDLCTSRVGPVSGVNNVEAYWSMHENACIIPTIWSVRRTLAWAGTSLNGKGLRSLQDPIPSLNKFIVNW
jgi:hypothetical protein